MSRPMTTIDHSGYEVNQVNCMIRFTDAAAIANHRDASLPAKRPRATRTIRPPQMMSAQPQ